MVFLQGAVGVAGQPVIAAPGTVTTASSIPLSAIPQNIVPGFISTDVPDGPNKVGQLSSSIQPEQNQGIQFIIHIQMIYGLMTNCRPGAHEDLTVGGVKSLLLNAHIMLLASFLGHAHA
jgi:hypothetical protein